MGWHRWRNGRLYYVTRRSEYGTIVRTYGGTGEAGKESERLDREERENLRRIRAEAWEMTDLMCDHENILHRVIRLVMNEHGYVWRSAKWRHTKNLKRPPGSTPKFQRLEKYMPQIEQKSVKRRSKENPVSTIEIGGNSVGELKDALAEIQATMRAKCLSAFGYDDEKTKRLIEEFAEMSRRLENKDLTDLERLAAEQIITCWIQTTVTGYRLEGLAPGQQGGRMASFLEHRHNMAHSRLLRSMDMLSKLRESGVGGEAEPEGRHGIRNVVMGKNRDIIFDVKSHVCNSGSKYDIMTTVYRGDGWVRGVDDVERYWEKNCK